MRVAIAPGLKPVTSDISAALNSSRYIAFDQAAQVGQTRHLFEFVKVDTHDRAPSFTIDMTCRNIVDDAVDPGFETAPAIKCRQAFPKLEMHVLQQVQPPFSIGLRCPCESLHRVGELVGGLMIARICGLTWLHAWVSLGRIGFLTKFFAKVRCVRSGVNRIAPLFVFRNLWLAPVSRFKEGTI